MSAACETFITEGECSCPERHPNPDNPTADFKLTFGKEDGGEDVVDITLEFHFSENAEDFIDPAEFTNVAAGLILREMLQV